MRIGRRGFLKGAAAGLALPPAIGRAAAIDPDVRAGTIEDVAHVVILMQENRAFDHYFGTMAGVRGFGDRFPMPVQGDASQPGKVWMQRLERPGDQLTFVSPFALDTEEHFELMRVEGTPHNWTDAQDAWAEGRMNRWPTIKTPRAMAHYRREDIPFQFALADTFTICDAYHCSFQGGTNTNRLFLWSGTNDPTGKFGGPSISNSHDSLPAAGGAAEGYRWMTYPERLQTAGVSWRIYQDMADNFSDNPGAGFASWRDSHAGKPGADPVLVKLGLGTRKLDGLREDVLAGALPKVSWIVAPAADSEHPGPSSPAQGADYTARVLDALTADPRVWARTALFVMFDENDGFFDHMPPPAPPSRDPKRPDAFHGGSTVDTTGEYHLVRAASEAKAERDDLMGRPYGLGPRAPMYVISPWSRGGWVDSQVYDHTSVIRFLERRFGVTEPNISPWRRAVCGDLTSAFDFRSPNARPFVAGLPATRAAATRAAALPGRTTPPTPAEPGTLAQARGVRPSRPLPYALAVDDDEKDGAVRLTFVNDGQAGAVFHVYDRLRLDLPPRRYTVERGGKRLADTWPAWPYDLWVLGPGGFHRHFVGESPGGPRIYADVTEGKFRLGLINPTAAPRTVTVEQVAYGAGPGPWTATLAPGGHAEREWPTQASGGWYELMAHVDRDPVWSRRLAGRIETGRDSISDPEMGGLA
ncbi:MAG: phospholipase C, phosphocholine-specific [Caulobacteraceae bacterium]|nr:phospholipase C, phosphocholine-specific [Caulobacteraceae bacterium]